MWVKSEAKRWGSSRALGERAPEIYNWDSGIGVGCWVANWLWSKETTLSVQEQGECAGEVP